MSAYDLLTPQAYLPIDCVEELLFISKNYPEVLKENPKGIYMVGKVDPVMTDGKFYFTKKGLAINEPIRNIDKINEDVYNAEGRVVINAFVMREKRKLLRNESQYSFYGIKAIYYYINKIIENHSAHIKVRRYQDQFISCFKPEYQKEILGQDIDIDFLLNNLSTKVFQFIGNDPWIIYLIKQLGTICLIEKTIDYRIFDWTLQKESEAEESQSLQEEQKTTRRVEIINYK